MCRSASQLVRLPALLFFLYFSFSVHEMASGDGSALADWQLWTYRGRDTSVARFHGFMRARNVWNIIPCVRINGGSARYYRVSLTLSFSSFSSSHTHTLFLSFLVLSLSLSFLLFLTFTISSHSIFVDRPLRVLRLGRIFGAVTSFLPPQ